MSIEKGGPSLADPSLTPWRDLTHRRPGRLRFVRGLFIALLLIGAAFVVIGTAGLLASIPNGDFKSSYQDEIPLMIEGTGLWFVGSAVLYWLRRRELTRQAIGSPASGCVVRTAPSVGTGSLSDNMQPTFWQRFRAGVRKNPLLGLALLLNVLATLVRSYAVTRSGTDVVGVLVGITVGVVFFAAVFTWIVHRGAVAAKRLTAVQWISPVGKLSLGRSSNAFSRLAEFVARVRRRDASIVPIRLVLTPSAFFLLPNWFKPACALQIRISQIDGIDVSIVDGRFRPGIAFRLRDGQRISLDVKADADLLCQIERLGGTVI